MTCRRFKAELRRTNSKFNPAFLTYLKLRRVFFFFKLHILLDIKEYLILLSLNFLYSIILYRHDIYAILRTN